MRISVFKGSVGVILTLLACDAAPNHTPADAGHSERDAGNTKPPLDAAIADAGVQASACRGQPALALEAVPEDVFAFHHLSADCEALKPIILLRNRGSSKVKVDRLEVSRDQFSVAAGALPRELLPATPSRFPSVLPQTTRNPWMEL